MAKETGWANFGDRKPLEEHVRLPMVADSSVETAVEIDTGLEPGMKLGWTLVGLDAGFRTVASPHHPIAHGAASMESTLQLCRGDLPATPVLLHPSNDNVIFDMPMQVNSETAVGYDRFDGYCWRTRKPERTQREKLYLMFGSDIDWAAISAATTEIFAILYYFLVSAPEISGHEE
jgi:hypothetical protein